MDMNYITSLTSQEKDSLALHLNTSKKYLYLYGQGDRVPNSKRAKVIIAWAEENTPDNVPTLEQLLFPENAKS